MTDADALYDVRERTGNPAHTSVGDVCDLLLSRLEDPRENHQDAYFDSAMAAIVDQYGEEAVQQVIRRILVDQFSHRTAATDLDMRPVDGVWIGTAAGWFLRELNAEQDS
ncbi:hypothetical protein [Halorussus litoreus]|uniref:hypothetical protein n=1 Tax=Halorussus litoreus TaxID=1710536 RepID=UPI000E26269F|nr:hypothetical protein [Halorussus litoreus]